MVCVSADNPAVTTVLELTEANCVPSNQNITVRIEARDSVAPHRYARDLAITAVICFIGGVCLTLLVVLIYYQVSRRKKLKESKKQKEEEEEKISTVVNHPVNHLDVDDTRRDLLWQAHRSQPLDRQAMTLDTWTDGHVGQFGSRTDEHGQFRCPDCSTKGQRGMGLNLMRWNNRINGGMEMEEEREKRKIRMMREEERTRLEQGILSRDMHNKLLSRSNTNSSSHPQKETFAQANRENGASNWTEMEGKSRGHAPSHCKSCHRTNRPPDQNMRQGRIHSNMKDSVLFEGVHPQHRQMDRFRNASHYQFDNTKNTEMRRELRNVTFDLESSRSRERGSSQGEDKTEEEARGFRDKERGKRHIAKVQSSRLLKVKLNINPLKKSKVHPKRKLELVHSEKSRSKKSKDKRQDGEDRGEREGKAKSGKKSKGGGEKTKRSTKTKGSTEDAEDEKEENRGEKGQEIKMSSKQEKGEQESTEGDQGEGTHPENFQLSDTANTADQSASALDIGQGQDLQSGSVQYQGAGLVMGSAQLSPQHPVSLSGIGRNHTNNPSLLGSAGSQLTGSNLSQGGNFLINTMAPGSLFHSGPASVAPGIAISEPNMATSIAPGGLNRQPGEGLMSPPTSLLANTVYANPLRAGAIHTSSLHTSQPAGLASDLAANPTVDPAPVQPLPQSKPPPDSSPLVARLTAEVQGQGLQTGEGVHPNLPTQAPPSVSSLSWMTPTAHGPVTTVENLSNNNSQTEIEGMQAGSTVHMSAGADVSVPGDFAPSMSTQSVSSTGDVVAATALLQQEYLSEEGGPSPRRKLRLVLPEKTSSRPPTALERKIR